MLSEKTPTAPATSVPMAPPTFASYDEFFAWAFDQGGHMEWAWLIGPEFPDPIVALMEVLGPERYFELARAAWEQRAQ